MGCDINKLGLNTNEDEVKMQISNSFTLIFPLKIREKKIYLK
jgi:hypothetical protein